MKFKKKGDFTVFIGALFILISLVTLTACESKVKETKESENFPVMTPLITDATINQEYVAEIQAMQNVELRSRVKGYLDKIEVDEGQLVKAGQVLFCISKNEYQEALTKANAELISALASVKTAELDVENTQTLVDKNVVSKTELSIAQAKLEALKAQVDEASADKAAAQLNLSYATIKAPFEGIVNRLPFKVGSLIDEGTLLTTISDDKQMYAYFNVSENDYLNLLKDNEQIKSKEATLILANNQPYPYAGMIETVDGEIDKSTGNISFRARFQNPNLLLLHGGTGKIVLTKTIKNAIVIPQKSTFDVQDKTYIYLVDKDNIVQLRNIKVLCRLNDSYIINSGITGSDRFIYEGIQLVKVGDKIIPSQIKQDLMAEQESKDTLTIINKIEKPAFR